MALMEWLSEALEACTLPDEAREHLMGRGATPELLDALRIKVFDCPLTPCPDPARHRHYGPHFERFEGKVIYPLYSPRGRLLGFEARSLGAKDIDQFLLPESAWNPVWIGMPLGMHAIWERRDLIVVEGNFDVFAMWHVKGGRGVVGSRSAHLTWQHVNFLSRWCARSQPDGRGSTVLMAYDYDKAGREGSAKAVKQLTARGVACAELRYGRPGDDPGALWDRGGVEALRGAFSFL